MEAKNENLEQWYARIQTMPGEANSEANRQAKREANARTRMSILSQAFRGESEDEATGETEEAKDEGQAKAKFKTEEANDEGESEEAKDEAKDEDEGEAEDKTEEAKDEGQAKAKFKTECLNREHPAWCKGQGRHCHLICVGSRPNRPKRASPHLCRKCLFE